jgi:chloramphenicol-sensitive protein RarD
VDEQESESRSVRIGVAYGLAAYGLWGVFPLYFKVLDNAGVTPWEILVHRILWSALLLAALITLQTRWRELWLALCNRKTLTTLCISTLLIAVNWLTFLYAIAIDQVLQASLGYFLTPLMNVLIGVTVLGERLRPAQLVGVGLASLGVLLMASVGGQLPWIALLLATTFAFYGLCRKTVAVDSMLGLSIETLLLAPLAGGVLWTLLALSGVATATPLLFFASAARRLRFVTIGFLQYVGPTIQFLIAVLVFGEAFSGVKVLSFSLIWLAIAIYCIDTVLAYRRYPAPQPQPQPALPLEDL